MFPVDRGQPHSKDSQAHIPEQESRRLTQRAGGGQRHDSPNAVPLHGVQDVSNPRRQDGRRIASRASEGAEDGVLARDRAIHRGCIEDIAARDLHSVVDNAHPARIADEGGDVVTLLHGSTGNPSARVTGCAEHNHVHENCTQP